MTMATPSFSQIKSQVAAVHQKLPLARVIGIHSSGRWTGDQPKRDGEHALSIHQCDSPLAIRQALREPVDEATTKVLVTPLDDTKLSDDILLRLAKRRLFQIDAWQIVRTLFQANAVDPRLTRHAWVAELLLEQVPPEGYPTARGGFLDADAIWPLLLRQTVGFAAEAPDLTTLLKWSLDVEATVRFRLSPQNFRQRASEWLVEKAGAVTEVILHCIASLDRPDAVPLGLAIAVIFHPAAAGKLDKASGKLEGSFLGGKSTDPVLMRRWSSAATEVVRALRHTEPKIYRQMLQRADDILCELQAEDYAFLSHTSLAGFDQRLNRVGQCLEDVMLHKSWNQLENLSAARQAVRDHDKSVTEAPRLERVEMAIRLVRWLGTQAHPKSANPFSLAEAAVRQLRMGGFVDWARRSLQSGDDVQGLSEAYGRLFEAVTRVREQQSQQFALLLKDWTASGSKGDQVIPVEQILERIVAPLAATAPLLLIVIDGMSVAVARELQADLPKHEWTTLCEPEQPFNRPGISTIPSVTEFARTSLMCGRLQQGGQPEEKSGFASHPALVAHCRSGYPPVLFHKAAYQETDDAVLSADIRKEIASTHRKIVGVVVNAVDDHLAKGEQIDTRWSRDAIKVLPALLHEARIARRLVVLVSDHGHMLDCQTVSRPGDGGERWRAATGQMAADELEIQGQRVLVPGHRLVAPWSERVRYGSSKKNGYHGGLTPQEMVIPITILSSTDEVPKGWQEQAVETPMWWDEPAQGVAMSETSVPTLKPAKPQLKGSLFDLETEEEVTPPPKTVAATAAAVPVPEWISRLLASPVFAEQKKLGGRGLLTDELLVKLLDTLDRRGGKLTSVALARALDCPEFRLPGLLAKVQRLLNIDGYGVLDREDASDTVELNRVLLLKQFDLV